MAGCSTREFKTWEGIVRSDVPFRGPFTDIPPEWRKVVDWKSMGPEVHELAIKYDRWSHHPKTQQVLLRERIPCDSPYWLEKREKILSATNINSIVHSNKSIRGENNYCSRKEVFLKKTGRGKPFFQNGACRHGVFYEPEAARVYELVTGIELVKEQIGLIVGNTLQDYDDCIVPDFIGATPDCVARYYPILIEIKCPLYRKIEHMIPDIYYPQAQFQMAVTGVQELHFVQYSPCSAISQGLIDIVVVKFDIEWFKAALNECLLFWDEVRAYYDKIGKPLGTKTEYSKLSPRKRPRRRPAGHLTLDLSKDERLAFAECDDIEKMTHRPSKSLIVDVDSGSASSSSASCSGSN